MYSDSSNLIKKFEKMISDDSSIFLDTDEVEEIILYYFNEGDIMMAEKAVALGNNLYPNSININILYSEILILKGEITESYYLIDDMLSINKNSQDLLFQKCKILTKLKKYKESISILKDIPKSDQLSFFVLDLLLKNYMNLENYEKHKNEFKSSLDLKSLKDKKLINKKYLKLKILGSGELKTKIDITAHFASKQAQEKVTKAGGKLNIIKK